MRGGGRVVPLGAVSGLTVVRADLNADGDFDALTAVAWEDSTKSGSGTINWNTAFGVPTIAKMVKVICYWKDDVTATWIQFRAKSTATNPSFNIYSMVANLTDSKQGDIPIAADGTSAYAFNATFTTFYLRVVGWYV